MTDEIPAGIERPYSCTGCGLQPAVEPDNPTSHETVYTVETVTDDTVQLKCGTCGTLTRVQRDPTPVVECRSCGDDIPESLQGQHACDAHPLEPTADQQVDPTLEDHR